MVLVLVLLDRRCARLAVRLQAKSAQACWAALLAAWLVPVWLRQRVSLLQRHESSPLSKRPVVVAFR